MADQAQSNIKQRLRKLEAHLQRENPVLLQVVKSFRQLDQLAYRLGLLERNESFATRVPWWPMVSVLGTFSSGKSTFINHYLGHKLQLTGNQAVDDKFTVVCFSSDDTPRVLPGLALDADPRFPFYQISRDIEEVAEGEGHRVDAYLQLKTSPSERLRGKILIDSPGFDADAQRTSTLRITDHIIDLSDLVLVFFDARHPEPGAMQDTLEHLVADTIKRNDSNKFLYILNQIDTTAREDNPEEVFGAWQRALAGKGLTAGRFYRIYDPESAIPIEDERLRERFESKRAADVAEIYGRMEQVEVERAYRIIGVLEQTAKSIENTLVPKVREAKQAWRKRVAWLDGIAFGLVAVAAVAATVKAGYWQGLDFVAPDWLAGIFANELALGAAAVGIAAGVLYVHFVLRKLAARWVLKGLRRKPAEGDMGAWVEKTFAHNAKPWHSVLFGEPVGWTGFTRRRISRILSECDRYVQALNDRFANPSGSGSRRGRFKPSQPPGGGNGEPAKPRGEDQSPGEVGSVAVGR